METEYIDALGWLESAEKEHPSWQDELTRNVWSLSPRTELRLLVARQGRDDVGFAVFQFGPELHLHYVVRKPGLRGAGVGQVLWDRLRQDYGDRAITAIPGSEDGLRAVRRWGFKGDGRNDWWRWEPERPAGGEQ